MTHYLSGNLKSRHIFSDNDGGLERANNCNSEFFFFLQPHGARSTAHITCDLKNNKMKRLNVTTSNVASERFKV